MNKRMLTTGEVGRYCGVHFRTVSRWIAQGKLKGHRLPGGRGDYRVQIGDFLLFLHEHALPIPTELLPATRRVLIVEDQPALARAIARTLGRAGFETRIAADGLQAGMSLQGFAPAVVTLDLNLPGADGFELLRFLRTRPDLAAIKVLALSALGAGELARATAEGAADALPKPFSSRELLARVQRLAAADAAGDGRGA